MTASSPIREDLIPMSSRNGRITFLFSIYTLFTIYISFLNVKHLSNQTLVDKMLKTTIWLVGIISTVVFAL